MRLAALSVVALLALGCTGEDEFGCSEDDQCENAGIQGFCQGNGYCAFSDETCPSGRRYGDLAGGGLAGVCVQEDGSTGAVTSASGSGGSMVTTVEPDTISGGTMSSGTSDSDPTDGSSATSETGTACPAAGVCAREPLPGWSGPVVLSEDGCAAEDPLFEAGTGLVPSLACDCQCAGQAEVGCQFSSWGDPNCNNEQIDFFKASSQCQPTFNFGASVEGIQQEDEGFGFCDGDPPTAAAIAELVAACDPAPLGTCEDGSACVEQPPGAAVCNWREGVHECPSADEQRTVLYRSASGAYDCGCRCEAATDQVCGELQFFADSDCTKLQASLTWDNFGGDCSANPGLGDIIGDYVLVPPSDCQDAGSRNTPEPLGGPQAPAEADPVTLCCQ